MANIITMIQSPFILTLFYPNLKSETTKETPDKRPLRELFKDFLTKQFSSGNVVRFL